MKNLKLISAMLLTVIILILSLPVTTTFAADPDLRYGRVQLGKMPNGANLQAVYDQLVSDCASAKTEAAIDLNTNRISFDELKYKIYPSFFSDYPEYFWLDGGWSDGWSDGSIMKFKPSYTMTGNALDAAKSVYNAKVTQLTSGLSGSNYDKAKTLHNRLIDTVTYTNTSNDQNAYGALVEGKAVCNGYAKAYQHLMLKAGIPAWYVRGSSINPSTDSPVGHAWNLVKIDGSWYYTDVTWDDQGDNIFYAYFNITTGQLLEDHSFDDLYASWVPTASATAANYYVNEGRNFSSFDKTKLVNLLKKDNTSQIYISGDINSFEAQFKNNFDSIAVDLGATGGYGYTITSLGRAMMINFTIISSGHTHSAKTTVAKINETCLSNGTKAYYICDCGLKFLDSACTQQITNEKQLAISAKSHTPSNWKNDTTNHWKECSACGSEIANTRGTHNDSNKDNKCDICGYALPVADANGNITVSGGTSDSSNSADTGNQTAGSSADNNTSSVNSDVSSKVESSDNNQEISGNENETVITDETTSSYEESYLYADTKPNDAVLKWIIICGGTAAVVTAGIAVSVILINKKKQ